MRKLLFSFLALGALFSCNDNMECIPCALPSSEQFVLGEAYAKEANDIKAKAENADNSIKYKDAAKKNNVDTAKAELEKLLNGDQNSKEESKKKSLDTLINEAKKAKELADADKSDKRKQDEFKRMASVAYQRATAARTAAEAYKKAVNDADKARFVKADITASENSIKDAIDSVNKLKDEDFNGGSADKTALKAALGDPETGGVKKTINDARKAVDAAADADKLKATADREIKTALEEVQKQVKDGKEASDSAVTKIKDVAKKNAVVNELARVERALKEARKKAKEAKD